MKKTKCFSISLALLCLCLNLIAQVKCGSELDMKWIKEHDPQRYNSIMKLEDFTEKYIQSVNSSRVIDPDGLIIIPVVVHLLYNTPDQNISDAVIQSQIQGLTEDYRRLNADRVNTPARFAGRAADFNIEFRLASFDPNGNPTTGIERKYTSKNVFTLYTRTSDGSYDEERIGIKVAPTGFNSWATDRYLNIWIANISGTLGYSKYPDDYTKYPMYDGVVIRNSLIGRYGRTVTHEIGHWLNLRHLWGDTYCGDDLVGDTPKQANLTAGCPTGIRLSCGGADPDGDMYMNYMDYTNDACMNLFTLGQKQRARAVFATVGGVPGPRATHIDGFFGFHGQPTTIYCGGKVTVCAVNLPVTWTVSGPATITSGAGTSQINLTVTGNGVVNLTATSGNYTSSTSINVSYGLSGVPAISSLINEDCSISLAASLPGATCYDWFVDGSLLIQGTSTTALCAASNTLVRGGSGVITVRGKSGGCISNITSTGVSLCQPWNANFRWLYSAPASGEPLQAQVDDFPGATEYIWSVGGQVIERTTSGYLSSYNWPCTYEQELTVYAIGPNLTSQRIYGGYYAPVCYNLTAGNSNNVRLSPNPAQSNIAVTLISLSKEQGKNLRSIELNAINRVSIYDKTGTMRKSYKFGGNNPSVTIDVSWLAPDIYYVEVSDKNQKVRLPLSIVR